MYRRARLVGVLREAVGVCAVSPGEIHEDHAPHGKQITLGRVDQTCPRRSRKQLWSSIRCVYLPWTTFAWSTSPRGWLHNEILTKADSMARFAFPRVRERATAEQSCLHCATSGGSLWMAKGGVHRPWQPLRVFDTNDLKWRKQSSGSNTTSQHTTLDRIAYQADGQNLPGPAENSGNLWVQ